MAGFITMFSQRKTQAKLIAHNLDLLKGANGRYENTKLGNIKTITSSTADTVSVYIPSSHTFSASNASLSPRNTSNSSSPSLASIIAIQTELLGSPVEEKVRLLEEKILELSSLLTNLSADNQILRRDNARLQEAGTKVEMQFRDQEQTESKDQHQVPTQQQIYGQDQIYGEDSSQGQDRTRRNRGPQVQVGLMKLMVSRARLFFFMYTIYIINGSE